MTKKEYREKIAKMKKVMIFLYKEKIITLTEKNESIRKLNTLQNQQILVIHINLDLQIKFEHN